MEYRKGLIFILLAVNIFLSFYLLYAELASVEGICLTGFNCKTVQESPYSAIFGIKLSVLGIIFFSVLLIISILDYKDKIKKIILPIVSLIGAVFASYFLFLQFFIIKAICSTCLVIDSFAILISILAVFNYSKKN